MSVPIEVRYAKLQTDIIRITDQAKRYLEGIYGDDIWLNDPQTIRDPLERWFFGVATGNYGLSEGCMKEIEHHFQAHHRHP